MNPRNTKAALGLTAALFAAAGLAGCGSSATAPAHHSSSPAPSASTSPAVQESPTAFAAKVFPAWADRSASYHQWWAKLSPMLSPFGKAAFAHTNPSYIPAVKVTGPYTLGKSIPNTPATQELDPTIMKIVWVPTNLGRFGIVIEPGKPGSKKPSGWRMYSLVFPKGIH